MPTNIDEIRERPSEVIGGGIGKSSTIFVKYITIGMDEEIVNPIRSMVPADSYLGYLFEVLFPEPDHPISDIVKVKF